jgi:hypothetical protein
MKKLRFHFYISGEYDKFLSKAVAWWSGLWNKKTIPAGRTTPQPYTIIPP